MSDFVSDTLGLRFLTNLVRTGSLRPALQAGITTAYFRGDARKVWRYLASETTNSDQIPSLSQVYDQCDIRLDEKRESLDYLTQEIIRRQKSEEIREHLIKVAELLEKKRVDEAENLILAYTSAVTDSGETGLLTDSLEETLQKYEDQWLGKTATVIRTPWPSLTETTGGWGESDIITILASSGVGKSWWSCVTAVDAARHGKNVLFVSMEMGKFSIERRVHAVVSQTPFSDLRDYGRVSRSPIFKSQVQRRIRRGMRALPGKIAVFDETSCRTFDDVLARYYMGDFDMIIVDGAYLLEWSDGSVQGFDKFSRISDHIRRSAKAIKRPVILTSQYNEVRDQKGQRIREMNLEGSRYTKEFVNNSHIVIAAQPRTDSGAYQLSLQVLKVREGSSRGRRDILVNWDVNTLDFSEVPTAETAYEPPGEVSYGSKTGAGNPFSRRSNR